MVSLDPVVGAEMRKTRPVVVINADGLATLPLRIIVPIIGWQPKHAHNPWMVHLRPDHLNGQDKDGAVDCFQLRCVDLTRFVTRRGEVSPAVLDDLLDAAALSLDL